MSWLRANRVSAKDPLGNQNQSFAGRSSMDYKNKSSSDTDISTPDKIKSNPSFSLQKINERTIDSSKAPLSNIIKKKEPFKLPNLKKNNAN